MFAKLLQLQSPEGIGSYSTIGTNMGQIKIGPKGLQINGPFIWSHLGPIYYLGIWDPWGGVALALFGHVFNA